MREIRFECDNDVCAKYIRFIYAEDTGSVHNVYYKGGCSGNTAAVSALCEGMDINWIIPRLYGIRCASKFTSCGDQLAQALKQVRDGSI